MSVRNEVSTAQHLILASNIRIVLYVRLSDMQNLLYNILVLCIENMTKMYSYNLELTLGVLGVATASIISDMARGRLGDSSPVLMVKASGISSTFGQTYKSYDQCHCHSKYYLYNEIIETPVSFFQDMNSSRTGIESVL